MKRKFKRRYEVSFASESNILRSSKIEVCFITDNPIYSFQSNSSHLFDDDLYALLCDNLITRDQIPLGIKWKIFYI